MPDEFINRLTMSDERNSGLEGMSVETSKKKKKCREKRG